MLRRRRESLMDKSKHKISNWQQYNQALVQRGSLTIWMHEQAIKRWYCQTHHGRRGQGFHYSDTAIETALIRKGLFKLTQPALESFIKSIKLLFQLMAVDTATHQASRLKSVWRRWQITRSYRRSSTPCAAR